MRPATVIGWHRQGFRALWRRRSNTGQIGRPRIPRKHIAFIQRISGDHPEWGEDKLAEELAAKSGIEHSASTIRRHMVPRWSTPRGDQTWRTFVRNHAKEVWACDFLTQYTALFAVAYVFVVMEIHSRRIVHVNVTANPTLPWVKQQIREATAWDEAPRFLVHDNDGIFGQYGASANDRDAPGPPSSRRHSARLSTRGLRRRPPTSLRFLACTVTTAPGGPFSRSTGGEWIQPGVYGLRLEAGGVVRSSRAVVIG